jgi:hypothetical protein
VQKRLLTRLWRSYVQKIDGSTIVTFGIDTNSDLNIDVAARFEGRGTDAFFAYVTDTDDDFDKTATGSGGDWLLRNPKESEPNALNISDGNAFLVKYSGNPCHKYLRGDMGY